MHRTIKGRYLRNRKFESIKALSAYLKWAVQDYNELRPHYKHRPKTPYEVYFDIPLNFNLRKRIKQQLNEGLRIINALLACNVQDFVKRIVSKRN